MEKYNEIFRLKDMLEKENIEYDINEPFTITFSSGEHDMHGIKNIGESDLVFQVLCAPSFSDDEEHFVQ